VRVAYSSLSHRQIDGLWQDAQDQALVRRHLVGLPGPVLDLGGGPGHWTGYLPALGADVTGVDLVPDASTEPVPPSPVRSPVSAR